VIQSSVRFRGFACLAIVGMLVAACTTTVPPSPSIPPSPSPLPSPGPSSPPRPSLGPSASPEPCGRLQQRIDQAESGSVLDLTGCTYEAAATIDKPLVLTGATIRPPRGTPGLIIDADDVSIHLVRLLGPDGETWENETTGIAIMAPPASPVARLRITDSEIRDFSNCIRIRNVQDPYIAGNTIEDCVYAGVLVLSATGGIIEENEIRRIGTRGADANDGNAYGIAVSHQFDDDPASSDVIVRENTVEDVPTWHGLDTHGGSGILFFGNRIGGSSRAIFITGGPNGARASDIDIVDNVLLGPEDPTRNDYAITTYDTSDVRVRYNTASGWLDDHFFNDYTGLSTGVTIESNTIEP
jgi:hypothetical protein